jgi:hypothetical protein
MKREDIRFWLVLGVLVFVSSVLWIRMEALSFAIRGYEARVNGVEARETHNKTNLDEWQEEQILGIFGRIEALEKEMKIKRPKIRTLEQFPWGKSSA